MRLIAVVIGLLLLAGAAFAQTGPATSDKPSAAASPSAMRRYRIGARARGACRRAGPPGRVGTGRRPAVRARRGRERPRPALTGRRRGRRPRPGDTAGDTLGPRSCVRLRRARRRAVCAAHALSERPDGAGAEDARLRRRLPPGARRLPVRPERRATSICSAGWGVFALGRNHPAVRDALKAVARRRPAQPGADRRLDARRHSGRAAARAGPASRQGVLRQFRRGVGRGGDQVRARGDRPRPASSIAVTRSMASPMARFRSTAMTSSATGFEPLLPDCVRVPFNDLAALEHALRARRWRPSSSSRSRARA